MRSGATGNPTRHVCRTLKQGSMLYLYLRRLEVAEIGRTQGRTDGRGKHKTRRQQRPGAQLKARFRARLIQRGTKPTFSLCLGVLRHYPHGDLSVSHQWTPNSAPDQPPISHRFEPGESPIRARSAPDPSPIRARSAPDPPPISARSAPFWPDPRPWGLCFGPIRVSPVSLFKILKREMRYFRRRH